MTFRARFGHYGDRQGVYLPGTEPGLLPALAADALDPNPALLDGPPFAPLADGVVPLRSGAVLATTTGFGTSAARMVFDVTGAWNSVKNVSVITDAAARLSFLGFVHVDVTAGLGSEEGSDIALIGAKRGNVITGVGDDQVEVQLVANAHVWTAGFRIGTGDGDDRVRIAALDLDAAVAAGDATFSSAAGLTSLVPGYRGQHSTAAVALGAGDDSLVLEGAARAIVEGGAGADRISLGSGDDSVLGGEGADSVLGGAGDDTLRGEAGRDTLLGGDGRDLLEGGAEEDTLVGWTGDDTLIGGDGRDLLEGGAGADSLEGGEGDDTAVLAGAAADFEVLVATNRRSVVVRDRDAPGGADTLLGVEHLRFDDGTMDLPAPLPQTAAGLIFFALGEQRDGYDLWVADGPELTPRLLQDFVGWSSPSWPISMGDGRALFSAATPTAGQELWITDGTAAGTGLVRDVLPGVAGSSPHHILSLGDGRAVFWVGGGSGDHRLWITDGSAAGTWEVAGAGIDWYSRPVALGDGRAGFITGSDTVPREFWVTDGTGPGTTRVPGLVPAWLGEPARLGDGRALVVAVDGADGANDRALWVTDGTAAGTQRLVDGLQEPLFMAVRPVAIGEGRAVFTAGDAAHGTELWTTDGTPAGTHPVTDLRAGTAGSDPRAHRFGEGLAMFTADDGSGRAVWVTDGTAAGTRRFFEGAQPEWPTDLLDVGDGRILFTARTAATGRELWISDGTTAGTHLVADIQPGPYDSDPSLDLALGDGRVILRATDFVHGSETWITDGTLAGTHMLFETVPGQEASTAFGYMLVSPAAADLTFA